MARDKERKTEKLSPLLKTSLGFFCTFDLDMSDKTTNRPKTKKVKLNGEITGEDPDIKHHDIEADEITRQDMVYGGCFWIVIIILIIIIICYWI